MDGSDTLAFDFRPNAQATSPQKRAELIANPGFGRVFTDHMVTIRYVEGRGWHDARVHGRAPVQLDPAAAVLHYAQEIFEGLKAYRTADGGAAMFRPEANAARFRQSAERMAMAPLPEALFLESVEELVRVDRDWIPSADERQPLSAAVHVRERGVPGGQAVRGIPLHGDRLARSAPISRAGPGRSRCGSRRTTPAPRPAAPARPSAAETTPPASWPRPRRSAMAATRWCSWTRSSAGGSRSSAA